MTTELARCATADEVRAVFRAAREREEGGADGFAEAPAIAISAASVPRPPDDDPATRALDALFMRLEQVATARAEAHAQAQTEAGLRELRTRVLEGMSL